MSYNKSGWNSGHFIKIFSIPLDKWDKIVSRINKDASSNNLLNIRPRTSPENNNKKIQEEWDLMVIYKDQYRFRIERVYKLPRAKKISSLESKPNNLNDRSYVITKEIGQE